MKIAIIGYSGSGKSTLARRLGEIYNCPCLHLDMVQFCAGWVERDKAEGNKMVEKFMKNEEWVIEGMYSNKFYFNERMQEADIIIFMDFPRIVCFIQAFMRYLKNRNTVREDMAEGCEEKFDLEFAWWLLHKGRTQKRKNKFRQICNEYSKKIIILKNRKDVHNFLSKSKNQ